MIYIFRVAYVGLFLVGGRVPAGGTAVRRPCTPRQGSPDWSAERVERGGGGRWMGNRSDHGGVSNRA